MNNRLCQHCFGTGYKEISCVHCNGSGISTTYLQGPRRMLTARAVQSTCRHCSGTGIARRVRCPRGCQAQPASIHYG